jgi:hypothetical protein
MDREEQIRKLISAMGWTRERAEKFVDARAPAADATAQAPREGPPQTYGMGDVARTAAQGLTFGFGDEIESAVTGRPVDEIRAGIDAFREARPVGSFLTEAAGGMVPGIAGGALALRGAGAAAKAGFGSQLLRGAGAGAAGGAAYGIGSGENTASRVTGGLLGGVAGGVAGAAFPVGAALTRRAGGMVKNAPFIREGLERVDDVVGLPGFLKPTKADEVADQIVLRAMAMDGIDEDEALKMLGQGESIDRIVDLFGGNTRRTARGAAAIQNPALTEAQDFLRDRTEAEGSRISDALTDILGVEDVNMQRVREGIRDVLRNRAKNAYDEAYAVTDYVPSTEVQRILNQPGIKDIAKEHQAMVRAFSAEAPDMFQFGLESGGRIGLSPRASVRSLDSLKRALDDQITSAYQNGQGTKAGMLREYRDAIVNDLDEKVPAYRQARQQYAGDRAVEEAFEAGSSMTLGTRKVDEVVALMEDMSQAEREMFRLGFVNNLRNQVGRNDLGRDIARTVMGVNPRGGVRDNTRQLFEAMFPDKNTDDLFGSLQREAVRNESRNEVLGGSRTASLQADLNDMLNADPVERVMGTASRRGFWAAMDEAGEQMQTARWGDVAGNILNRTVLQEPATAFSEMARRSTQEQAVEGLLRPARYRAGGSLTSGLLAGYLGGRAGNSLFPTRR